MQLEINNNIAICDSSIVNILSGFKSLFYWYIDRLLFRRPKFRNFHDGLQAIDFYSL
jgi:hypothetical protein